MEVFTKIQQVTRIKMLIKLPYKFELVSPFSCSVIPMFILTNPTIKQFLQLK